LPSATIRALDPTESGLDPLPAEKRVEPLAELARLMLEGSRSLVVEHVFRARPRQEFSNLAAPR